MKQFSIDIHAHSTLKPYSHQYPNPPLSLWDEWDENTNHCHFQSKTMLNAFSNKVLRHTQTSLEQAAKGNVKIIGISLFTFEAGWTGKRKNIPRPIKSLLSCLTGVSEKKIKYIHDRIDTKIYDDTHDEYAYLVEQIGKKYTLNGEEWEIKFLTRDILTQIQNGTLNPDNDNIIYVFINIEGIQSLGVASMMADEHDFPLQDDKANAVKKRINIIKNTWRSIPQYITLCHHFGNGLVGHAPSIPLGLKIAGVNQSNFINKGLTKNGKKVIEEMLGDLARPILVDIKHFSAQARKDFYAYIEGPLSVKYGNRKFPILCSHTGLINNMETLDELIQHTDNKRGLTYQYLHNATINMCKEDLEHIMASDGLIGIQIDRKRLMGKRYTDLIKEATPAKQKTLSGEIVWANIFTAVGLLNDVKAWDMLCIGSDYDGVVSYLPGVPAMSEYGGLKDTLKKVLNNRNWTAIHKIEVNGNMLDDQEITRLMFGYTTDELIDKIFSINAISFWQKHFIDQTLPEVDLVP